MELVVDVWVQKVTPREVIYVQFYALFNFKTNLDIWQK